MATLQSTQYWSVGASARFLGVSSGTIRNLLASGQLSGYVAPSGHRKCLVASVKAYANGTTTDDIAGIADGKISLGYARTSSISQMESLVRQETRLTAIVAERESIELAEVQIRKECCSSFGERKVFNQLVLDIVSGKIKRIYVEHWNRISRTMALNQLLNFLCDTYGVEIVALDRDENPDELANNLQELLDFVQVLSCRQAAQKSKLVTVKHLPIKTVDRIATLSNEGLNQKQIFDIIKEEGHKTEKGEEISKNKIRQYVLLNGKVKTVVGISPSEQTSLSKLLTEWVSANLVPAEDSRLTSKEVVGAFNDFLVANGKTKQPGTLVGKMLCKMGLPSKRVEGYRFFMNVALA